jgi:hypothetical protein
MNAVEGYAIPTHHTSLERQKVDQESVWIGDGRRLALARSIGARLCSLFPRRERWHIEGRMHVAVVLAPAMA